MANPNNDWSQFYSNQTFFTTTTTTTTTATSADSPISPESRRVSKPTRRKSRASRRTPTTLLNTDPANFRAMVQQFTGGPSAVAFGSPSSGFSLTSSDPTAGASSAGYQYANFQNQVAHHHELPQQQRPYMFSSSNHVNTHPSYPNTVVSDGFVTVDESRDRVRGGGGYDPSSERNSHTTSWLQ